MRRVMLFLVVQMLCFGLLSGCGAASIDPATLYDNTSQIAAGKVSFQVGDWNCSYYIQDVSIDYTASAQALVGAKEALAFTMNADTANVDVYDTIYCDSGACKILITNSDTNTVVAEYQETAYDTIKLQKGNYQVYLVGKDDASFTANLSFYSPDGEIDWFPNVENT